MASYSNARSSPEVVRRRHGGRIVLGGHAHAIAAAAEPDRLLRQRERAQTAGADVNDAIDFLQWPFDQQQRGGVNHGAIALKKIRDYDGIGGAGLIFEGDEAKPFRRTGPLAYDHEARDLRPTAVTRIGQIGG